MFKDENKGEGPNGRLLPPFVQHYEWLRLSCLSALLFFLGMFIPVVGMTVLLCYPIPISLIGVRQGAKKAFLAIMFVAVIVFLSYGFTDSLSFIFEGAGFYGIVFCMVVKKAKTAGEAVFGLFISSIIAKLVFIGLMINTMGYNPFEYVDNALNSLAMSLRSTDTSEDVIQAIVQSVRLSIPSSIIMISGIDAFVNYFFVSKIEDRRQRLLSIQNAEKDTGISTKTGTETITETNTDLNTKTEKNTEINEIKILPLPPFEQWSFPRSLLAAFFTAFLIPFFDASNSSILLQSIEINLKILTVVIFLIQGASFIWWWMQYKSFSYGVRLSVFIVLFFLPILSTGFIIIGILDISLNLRERIRRNAK